MTADPGYAAEQADHDDYYRQSETACCPRETIPDSCGCPDGCECTCQDCDCTGEFTYDIDDPEDQQPEEQPDAIRSTR